MCNPNNPDIPTDEQLDAIGPEMQAVCDVWQEFSRKVELLYDACDEHGVSEDFIAAAIDAVKDGRTGGCASTAFDLAAEEM
ncbi:MAG: hypothetical protein IJ783_08950 [Kiritimatiellae bacterium]|nr:hypothetical protein [Kiritimatiellia bacterium]